MKYVIPAMNPSGGSIIITSSVAGVSGVPNMSAYITSKHAVIGIMRTATLELAASNIRVNTVHPGMVDTDMAKRIADNSGLGEEGFSESVCSTIPLGRYAQPEDVVGMACFLFSDAAAYCNGSEYFVDGGMRA
jgi:NAD(P)-dependent dehydrogenase (short-subunit alcohol dehydrogenase family)